MTITVEKLTGLDARIILPWRGVWIADVTVALDASLVVPSGKVTLTIAGETLVGTVDPRASGRFGVTAKLRIVGGAGSWDRVVVPRHYKNDAGVTSTTVLSTTAAEIGETVVDSSPVRYGVDFVRAAGPAARVLEGLEWFVDFDGTTKVGPRAGVPAPESLRLLQWDPLTQSGTVTCKTIVRPGTIIIDEKLDSVVVRDVEQTFNEDGARATVWASVTQRSRLSSALANVARESVGLPFLKTYRFRIVEQGTDGRLRLQAVDAVEGIPDALAIEPWPGCAGIDAKHTPGAEVLVGFIAGDKSRPVVVQFARGAPRQVNLKASQKVTVEPVLEVAGTTPVVLATSALASWISAVTAAINTLAPGSISPPLSPSGYSAATIKGA